MKDNRVTTYKG